MEVLMSVKPTKQVKSTKPARASGRSLADFYDYTHSDDQPLYPAERKLLEACRQGEPYFISEQRPEVATDENTIRGSFLRFLALGGDDENPVHEAGILLSGAYIQGEVDLDSAHLVGDLTIRNSVFEEEIVLIGTHVKTLLFEGSYAKQGILADGISASGSIFLRDQFKSDGEVRFLGAQINGDLTCKGSSFSNRSEDGKGIALACDRMEVRGNVSLGDGFKAEGQVRLPGAKIGGQLNCEKGSFLNKEGNAFLCEGMKLSQAILFREIIEFEGNFNINFASCSTLVDDKASWDKVSKTYLAGFSFERHSHYKPWSPADFINWLEKDDSSGVEGFHPQPWRHLVGVLRRAERHEDANQIAIHLQEKLRKKRDNNDPLKPLLWIWGSIAGFGYRPMRLLGVAAYVWLACAIFYDAAREYGVFSPTNPIVFEHKKYDDCRPQNGTPWAKEADGFKGNWALCSTSPNEYTTFHPLLYSLDLILPLVDLQQDKDWAPMPVLPKSWLEPGGNPKESDYSIWGMVTRWVMWLEIIFGWVVSLLFVAIVSGLVRNVEKEE
jgi:hypothetical protein